MTENNNYNKYNNYNNILIENAVNISKDLIKINSVNPEFGGVGEKEKGEYVLNKIKEYINKYNINNYIIKEYNTCSHKNTIRPNIVVKFNFNKPKTLHIISHLDIVPEGDLKLWDNLPYEPIIKDGVIYGRGSEDNHKGIVSSLLLLDLIYGNENNNNNQLKYNLNLIFVSDEECGSEYGIRHILKYKNEIFNKEDLIIIPDFGTPTGEYIEIAEKNILWLNFKIKGKQCHGSTPENGVNSNILAFNFGNELYNYLYSKYNKKDNLFDPSYSTFEPTILYNNIENTNTIPGLTQLNFDCRILPEYNINELLNDIDNFIDNFIMGIKSNPLNYLKYYDKKELNNISIDYSILNLETAQKTPENSEVVLELKNSIKKVLNKEPILCGMGGGTVGAFLRKEGYNTAIWGIGEETAHQPNEHIKLEDLIKMANVYYEIINNK